MSHSITVTLIADQEIKLIGKTINIHNLKTIYLDPYGEIVGFYLYPTKKEDEVNNTLREGEFVDAGTGTFKLKK